MIHMEYAVVTAAEMAAAVTAVAVWYCHAMTALMILQRMVQNAVIQHGMVWLKLCNSNSKLWLGLSGCNCPNGPPECGDGVCNGDETYETCPQDCLARGTCADGEVLIVMEQVNVGLYLGLEMDSQLWKQYGADLTCYDNDGGDCGGLFSSNDRVRPINNDSQITKVFNPNENNRKEIH